jgi:hypothetical protein
VTGTSMMPSTVEVRAFEDAKTGHRVANVVVRQDRHTSIALRLPGSRRVRGRRSRASGVCPRRGASLELLRLGRRPSVAVETRQAADIELAMIMEHVWRDSLCTYGRECGASGPAGAG